MFVIRALTAVLALASLASAQAPPAAPGLTGEAAVAAAIANLDRSQTTVQALSQALRTLQANLKVADAVKAQVDKLAAEAATSQSAGNLGEARRRLLHAVALQRGLAWDQKAEFSGSLRLRTAVTVTDSARPFYAALSQSYTVAYPAPVGLRLRLTVADFAAPDKVIRELGAFDVYPRDLVEEPYTVSASLAGLADGPYQVAAELSDRGTVLRRLTVNVLTVRDFDPQQAAIERRLAKVQGFESAKATIRYPFDYARVINLGRRDLIPGRNPEDSTTNAYYDFSAEIRRSLQLLTSIEAGKDPLLRTKGEHARHYAFADAGEIMPYRVFVPSKYDGKARLPLVVILHGSGADQDTYFKLRGPVLTTEAEKHGFIVVTPLGHRPSGGWGRSGGPGPAGPAGPAAATPDPARARASELSEKDAFNVIDLVSKEYGTDPSRTYLMGNSMGGGGTWYLGAKYPEKWAAIAPCAATTVGEGFPYERLKGMPLLYTVGEKDNVERSREMVRWAKERGFEIPIDEIKDGTHDMSIWINLPTIFNFFEQHRRK
jgi:pimeloyl-ACP methyl ester carboxylesterase